ELMGFEPETIGGTGGKVAFARALTDHCAAHDAFEALCDAVVASKHDADPKVATLGLRGLLPLDEIALGDRVGPFVVTRKLGEGAPKILLVDASTDRLRPRAPANGHIEPWPLSSPKTVAPEQLRGYGPTPASDLYAFGAVLFEMLTGKPVFEAKTVADALVAHLSEAPRPPSAVAPPGWVTRDPAE